MWAAAKIFTASLNTYCLAGRLQLRCCEGEGGGRGLGQGWWVVGGGAGEGSAEIQFTILAGSFFSLCGHGGDQQQPAGTEDTGRPRPPHRSHMDSREERKDRERRADGVKRGGRGQEEAESGARKVRNAGEVILLIFYSPSTCPPPFLPSAATTSSSLLHFNFRLSKLQLKP